MLLWPLTISSPRISAEYLFKLNFEYDKVRELSNDRNILRNQCPIGPRSRRGDYRSGAFYWMFAGYQQRILRRGIVSSIWLLTTMFAVDNGLAMYCFADCRLHTA